MFSRCVAVLVLALAVAGSAVAAGPVPVAKVPAAPEKLHAFLLRPGEAARGEFTRTPSFAWRPVRGAMSYEFELASSPTFVGNSVLWTATGLKTPAISLPLSLPWVTDSLYAHVRAVNEKGTGPWSRTYRFRVVWSSIPRQLPSGPGYVRWSAVDGATAYQVWYLEPKKVFSTVTTVADQREYYAFHSDRQWTAVAHWRVRAVRATYGRSANGLPAVSYGPWSPVYVHRNPPVTPAGQKVATLSTVSNVASTGLGVKSHALTPGYAFAGNLSLENIPGGPPKNCPAWLCANPARPAPGTPTRAQIGGLYRVYVFSDKDCVNLVYKGAVVGSPAYAPRTTGPLKLPATADELGQALDTYLSDGKEPDASFMADGTKVVPTETPPDATNENGEGGGSFTFTVTGSKVELWDNGPTSRYFWTVVPVQMWFIDVEIERDSGESETVTQIEYHDLDLPQDACQSGRVLDFAKLSQPVVASSNTPYAAGLDPKGRLTSAVRQKPAFYGTPLVAWQPAIGADEYQIEWSPRRYPWTTAGSLKTAATSAVLPLKPGTWWYRVRGLNFSLPGDAPQLSWSAPAEIVVAAPRFRVVGQKK